MVQSDNTHRVLALTRHPINKQLGPFPSSSWLVEGNSTAWSRHGGNAPLEFYRIMCSTAGLSLWYFLFLFILFPDTLNSILFHKGDLVYMELISGFIFVRLFL